MSLNNRTFIFGVHSVTPYNRTTGMPYGTAKVVGECSMKFSGALVELYGGSSRFAWDVQDGTISSDCALKIKEYPDFVYELFLGKAPTSSGVDTAGAVSALTNKNGTLVAAVGLASVGIKSGSKADLKFTKYVVKATDATHVDVYAMSDVDFARGTDKEFENEALKITASPLVIATDTAVEIPGYGLELTGGSGTIGMTAGDTATFEVKPPSTESMEVVIGGPSDTFPEFGLIMVAQMQGSGHMYEIDVYRAKGIGLPLSFAEKKHSESEITVKAFQDSSRSGVAKIRRIIAS